ncbi:MAG TPA: hypothetical protein ENJ20_05900 [Bacteroidetes bacterium]|nr:hypothetical protein [Bacteroidota bacterium]
MTGKSIQLLFFSFLFSTTLSAQLEKTIHQTFEVKDKKTIQLDIKSDSLSIVSWAGNSILTETKVKLYGASPSILKHFMEKEQRYTIKADTSGTTLLLTSVDKERKPIRTRSGESPEYVNIRIFVPEYFRKESETKWVAENSDY